MNPGQAWTAAGAAFALLSVVFGAFGAHGLDGKLEPRMLAVWETAARYQMYHALALVLFGIWVRQAGSQASVTGWAFCVGIILFSGSLYALALSDIKILGAVTPFGGVAFMVGWAAFFLALVRTR